MEVPVAQSNEASTNVTTPVETEVTEATVDNTFGVQLKEHGEARKSVTNLRSEEEEEFILESKLHVDVVQLLALGLVSYAQVWDASVTMAKSKNNYSIGRVFDIYEGSTDAYGDHVLNVTKSITADSVVDGLVYTNKYPVQRMQVIINSELKVDQYSGRSYYNVIRRGQNVTTGSYTAMTFSKKKFESKTMLRLYVHNVEEQTFRLNGKAVSLGEPDVYTNIRSGVVATFKPIYEAALGKISDDLMVHLTESEKSNQKLFLTVYKQILPQLKETRKALREKREQEIAQMASQAISNAEAHAPVNATV